MDVPSSFGVDSDLGRNNIIIRRAIEGTHLRTAASPLGACSINYL